MTIESMRYLRNIEATLELQHGASEQTWSDLGFVQCALIDTRTAEITEVFLEGIFESVGFDSQHFAPSTLCQGNGTALDLSAETVLTHYVQIGRDIGYGDTTLRHPDTRKTVTLQPDRVDLNIAFPDGAMNSTETLLDAVTRYVNGRERCHVQDNVRPGTITMKFNRDRQIIGFRHEFLVTLLPNMEAIPPFAINTSALARAVNGAASAVRTAGLVLQGIDLGRPIEPDRAPLCLSCSLYNQDDRSRRFCYCGAFQKAPKNAATMESCPEFEEIVERSPAEKLLDEVSQTIRKVHPKGQLYQFEWKGENFWVVTYYRRNWFVLSWLRGEQDCRCTEGFGSVEEVLDRVKELMAEVEATAGDRSSLPSA